MEAHALWQGKSRIELNDGRGHRVVVDLPESEGGEDAGTSGLELALLSFAACVLTIFPLVARRRRIQIESMELDMVGHRGPRAPTIERVDGTLRLRSSATPEEAETALRLTVRTCPVGVLFERAGVPVQLRLEPIGALVTA
ncbi:MAG TPA: OsmC family protein [Thermoplasmata archaeon]|nr:OsmC family protein [Thermoplasmata archaeon]